MSHNATGGERGTTPRSYVAVLSDIHGNLAALRAVAEHAGAVAAREGAELRVLCLGDVVDYGPEPDACVAWVAQHAELVVVGNHEAAMLNDWSLMGIDQALWPITLWTRATLSDATRVRIAGWPERATLGPLTLFHSSLVARDAYINNPRAAKDNLDALPTAIGLCGHTHVQARYAYFETELPALGLPGAPPIEGAVSLPLGAWDDLPVASPRVLLNPGSVGQPRRHPLLRGAGLPPDPRASYLLLREGDAGRWQARFERVDYPFEQTIALLRALQPPAALPPPNVGHPLGRELAEAQARLPALLPRVAAQLAARLRG